jgi:uncharacterized membrane protein YeaQ/YmgE (transglycosylase-associated protein family)
MDAAVVQFRLIIHTGETKMLNFIVWLIVGGIIGWVASMLLRTREGLVLNIIVGIVGAFIAGLVLTPFFGISTINQNNFSFPALMVSLLGAVILLAAVNLFRRGMVRG